MSHGIWLPSYRQRTLLLLMVILATTGYRRWLSRPWQWSLRDYMVIVAVCSAGTAGVPLPDAHDRLLHNARRGRSRLPEPGQVRVQTCRYHDALGDHPAHCRGHTSGDGADEKPHARKELFPICSSRQVHHPVLWLRMRAVRRTNAGQDAGVPSRPLPTSVRDRSRARRAFAVPGGRAGSERRKARSRMRDTRTLRFGRRSKKGGHSGIIKGRCVERQ